MTETLIINLSNLKLERDSVNQFNLNLTSSNKPFLAPAILGIYYVLWSDYVHPKYICCRYTPISPIFLLVDMKRRLYYSHKLSSWFHFPFFVSRYYNILIMFCLLRRVVRTRCILNLIKCIWFWYVHCFYIMKDHYQQITIYTQINCWHLIKYFHNEKKDK